MKKQKDIKKYLPYWETLNVLINNMQQDLINLEAKMSFELGEKNLEFFFCDGECAGIGDIERKKKLIHASDLDLALMESKK